MVSTVAHKVIDGETIKFNRFTVADLDALSDRFRADYSAQALKVAKEEKLLPDDLFQLKVNCATMIVDIAQLYKAARSPKWINIFLKQSLATSGISEVKQDEILSKIPHNEKVTLAEMLIYDVPEVIEEKKGEAPLSPTTVELPAVV